MGINQFKGLFDKVDIAVNEASNSSNTNTFNNVLKHTLHREGPYKCIVANANSVSGELSLKLISSSTYKGDKEIEGRTILRRAQDVMANGRKALAVAMHPDSPYRHGTLPSGHCLADYHDYILEHMEKLLKGQPPISVEDTGRDRHTDNEDIPTQTMLPNATAVDVSSTGTKHPRTNRDFIFRGWMVFALLGFIVPDGMEQYKTQLFNLQNPPGGTDNGRKKARKEQAKKASGVRNDNAEGDRGVSTQQQIQLASLANQRAARRESMALMRKRSAQDELAMQLSLTMGKVHTHHQQADQQLKLVSQLGITDQEHTLMKKYFQYQTSRDDAQERLTQLESEFTANANGREVNDGDLNHDDDAIIDAAISRLAAPTRLTKRPVIVLTTKKASLLHHRILLKPHLLQFELVNVFNW